MLYILIPQANHTEAISLSDFSSNGLLVINWTHDDASDASSMNLVRGPIAENVKPIYGTCM